MPPAAFDPDRAYPSSTTTSGGSVGTVGRTGARGPGRSATAQPGSAGRLALSEFNDEPPQLDAQHFCCSMTPTEDGRLTTCVRHVRRPRRKPLATDAANFPFCSAVTTVMPRRWLVLASLAIWLPRCIAQRVAAILGNMRAPSCAKKPGGCARSPLPTAPRHRLGAPRHQARSPSLPSRAAPGRPSRRRARTRR